MKSNLNICNRNASLWLHLLHYKIKWVKIEIREHTCNTNVANALKGTINCTVLASVDSFFFFSGELEVVPLSLAESWLEFTLNNSSIVPKSIFVTYPLNSLPAVFQILGLPDSTLVAGIFCHCKVLSFVLGLGMFC